MSLGRIWTKRETELLKENYGTMTYIELSEAIGKPVSSIKSRARYLKLGACCDASCSLTFTVVHRALFGYNPNKKCIERLERKRFPMEVKMFDNKQYRMVKPERLWSWLKRHKDEINFVRFEKYSLGWEPTWVDEKRKADWVAYNERRWGL